MNQNPKTLSAVIPKLMCSAMLIAAATYCVILHGKINKLEKTSGELKQMFGIMFVNYQIQPDFIKETMPEERLRALIKVENQVALGRMKSALFTYFVYQQRGFIPDDQVAGEKFAASIASFYQKAGLTISTTDPAGWLAFMTNSPPARSTFAPGISTPEFTKDEYTLLSQKFVNRYKDQFSFSTP
jgi:hypothetical protein